MNELVNAQATTNHGTIFNHHMARHLDGIGHDDVVGQLALVAEMAVGHQQIAITDAGDFTLVGAAVDRDALSDGVLITNHHLSRCSAVLEVLGLLTDAGPSKNLVVTAQAHAAIEHHMGANRGAGADAHLGADHGIGTNADAAVNLRRRINHRGGMNLRSECGAAHRQSTNENISSPEQTSSPSTVASARTLPKR